MQPVLKNTYDYFETIKGRRLLFVVLFSFLAFLLVGVLLGQLPAMLEQNTAVTVPEKFIKTNDSSLVERSGKVVYVDPSLYPGEGISYKLIDTAGKDIILLKASDDKLKIIEGASVKLRGRIVKTANGKSEVLFVDQIVFK